MVEKLYEVSLAVGLEAHFCLHQHFAAHRHNAQYAQWAPCWRLASAVLCSLPSVDLRRVVHLGTPRSHTPECSTGSLFGRSVLGTACASAACCGRTARARAPVMLQPQQATLLLVRPTLGGADLPRVVIQRCIVCRSTMLRSQMPPPRARRAAGVSALLCLLAAPSASLAAVRPSG